jgi:RND family efflux transporter MFP subunit
LQFVDSAVDAATGTIKVRARFENREAKLWPGAFVKVALVSQTLKGAVVIPTTAIVQSARGPIVYLSDKGKAVLRPVKVLASEGEFSAVGGIASGDRVVVEGRQNLRPDSPLVERTAAQAAPARPAAPVASAASAAS